MFLPEWFCFCQDGYSDDGHAVLSLPGTSPVESIHLEEELLLDQIEDFKNPDESTKTEGAVVIS